jgi:hypothetical protein
MTDEAMSPLRRRMIEDMSIRKFAPKTQHDYVQRVKDFAAFLGRSPDTATLEDVRGFQLRLTSSGAGSARGTAARSPSAVSSPGGFRTPALGVRGTGIHRAGIRNPSQKQKRACKACVMRAAARYAPSAASARGTTS